MREGVRNIEGNARTMSLRGRSRGKGDDNAKTKTNAGNVGDTFCKVSRFNFRKDKEIGALYSL